MRRVSIITLRQPCILYESESLLGEKLKIFTGRGPDLLLESLHGN